MLRQNKSEKKSARHSITVVLVYVCTRDLLCLFELLTFVSWHCHTDCLSLALPPVDRIVSHSGDQHGKLRMSLSASFILHLPTEWIHDWMNRLTAVCDHSTISTSQNRIHYFMISSILSFSYSLSTTYRNNHIKVCSKYRLSMLD